jgi:hypothetical protein
MAASKQARTKQALRMAKPCTNKVPCYNPIAAEHSEKMFILSWLKPSPFVRIVHGRSNQLWGVAFLHWSAGFVRAFIFA